LPHLALDTLDEVIEKVCDGLKQLESDPERLRSMTYYCEFSPSLEHSQDRSPFALLGERSKRGSDLHRRSPQGAIQDTKETIRWVGTA
jgi:hypothetical protein